jgi:integral membrane sensor domain MASE1
MTGNTITQALVGAVLGNTPIVTNNKFLNISNVAVSFEYGPSITISNNVVANSSLLTCFVASIGSQTVQVIGNTFENLTTIIGGSQSGCVFVVATNITVEQNRFIHLVDIPAFRLQGNIFEIRFFINTKSIISRTY